MAIKDIVTAGFGPSEVKFIPTRGFIAAVSGLVAHDFIANVYAIHDMDANIETIHDMIGNIYTAHDMDAER